MTETSPLGSVAWPPKDATEGEEHWRYRSTAGRPGPLVELRIVDDEDNEVPWDGKSTGELQVRGPWIAREYFRDDESAEKFHDGWLRTGDIAAIDERGYIIISDRSKDVIKSGGEWISSVELENEIMAHPAVLEAAVVAMPDERWSERPLACVVLEEGQSLTAEELKEHLSNGWPSGGSPTTSRSSTPCPRPAWASSTRRCCARSSRRAGSPRASRPPARASSLSGEPG